VASLIVFAWALTRIESSFAGRTFAAYGGVYVAAALAWLVVIEGAWPDRWDLLGVGLCQPAGATTPEELLAASHATYFGIALRSVLAQRGGSADRITTTATLTADKGGGRIRIVGRTWRLS
jgi:drug/metabolite transporter superfamily protein YnfA